MDPAYGGGYLNLQGSNYTAYHHRLSIEPGGYFCGCGHVAVIQSNKCRLLQFAEIKNSESSIRRNGITVLTHKRSGGQLLFSKASQTATLRVSCRMMSL